MRTKTGLQQWKNSYEVLKCLKIIKHKEVFTYMKFDVIEFYPSISKDLFIESIQFSRKYVEISKDLIGIILHSCRTIIFFINECWIKKNLLNDFE